jgi:BlaI family penicillinase repressor
MFPPDARPRSIQWLLFDTNKEGQLLVSKYSTSMKRRYPSPYQMPLPTSAELAILSALWNLGPSTVREVHNALSSKRTGYTTVLKQMQIMAEKGLLTRSEHYRSHVYEPRLPKEQTQRELARNLLHRAFDGSPRAWCVAHFHFRRYPPQSWERSSRCLISSKTTCHHNLNCVFSATCVEVRTAFFSSAALQIAISTGPLPSDKSRSHGGAEA